MEAGNQFVHLVREMRKAQKKYFNERHATTLRQAKKLEQDIDEYLDAYARKDRENGQD